MNGDGDDDGVSPLVSLVRTAAAAVEEQARALRNHPNATLYSAIARLVPGAGQFLEFEPCLVCHELEKAGGGQQAAVAAESESQAAAAAAAAGSAAGGARAGVTAVTGLGAAAAAAGGGAPGGGGRSLLFLNYSLDSIKAASMSTENAMLVSGWRLSLSVLVVENLPSRLVFSVLGSPGLKKVSSCVPAFFSVQADSSRRVVMRLMLTWKPNACRAHANGSGSLKTQSFPAHIPSRT